MIAPIPKSILSNSVLYEKYIPDTGEGATYESAITLDFVAFQSITKRIANASGYTLVNGGVLFVDKKRSKANLSTIDDSLFTELSKVTYRGKTYLIESVERLDYNDITHHWELILK